MVLGTLTWYTVDFYFRSRYDATNNNGSHQYSAKVPTKKISGHHINLIDQDQGPAGAAGAGHTANTQHAASDFDTNKHEMRKDPYHVPKPKSWLYGPFGLISIVAMVFYWSLTMVSKVSTVFFYHHCPHLFYPS